ncbi:MAG: hypothetical protein ACXWP4_15760 [Polyangiales bacterium]
MRPPVLLVPLCAVFTVAVAVGASNSGCAADNASAPPLSDASVTETEGDSKIQDFEVHDDASAPADYCGEMQLCDPDVPAVCMVLVTDATPSDDADGAADASDAPVSETGAGTTSACRVVHRDNRTIAACAPAGKVAGGSFCASDDDCVPGFACVGPMGGGRCLRYCCAAFKDPLLAADAGGGTHYCTLQPLAARPMDKVPVLVKLDNCTLLDDTLQCAEGSTCTVVTNDGHTTCVPVGTGRDYASCAEDACDRGYVCLGSVDRRCRKLCKESEGAAACAGGAYCQRTPTIPEGYGICAGGDAG